MGLGSTQVLVTGGAGFIGSHVTRQVREAGASVDVLDNCFAGTPEYVPDDVTLHDVDVREQDAVRETVEESDPDVIVHLAAIHYIPYCNDNPEEAFDVNVMGTRHVLEAALDLDGLDRVVYTSSGAVYGARDEPHVESETPAPMDIYGRTKLVGEDLLERFHRATGVPSATARLFNTYGPRETNAHLIPAIRTQLEGDAPHEIELGNLSPERDFVYVGDVADALVTLATEFDDGYRAYNVGTGQTHSVREVVERVAEARGEDITIAQDENRVRESDRPHLCADTGRIEDELGWSAETEFVEGLRKLEKPAEVQP